MGPPLQRRLASRLHDIGGTRVLKVHFMAFAACVCVGVAVSAICGKTGCERWLFTLRNVPFCIAFCRVLEAVSGSMSCSGAQSVGVEGLAHVLCRLRCYVRHLLCRGFTRVVRAWAKPLFLHGLRHVGPWL